jgi:hypothetical protein
MSTVHTEQYQSQNSQDLARQRLAASRQEVLLYTHLLQASLMVERDNPLRQALNEHQRLVRNVAVTLVILLSVVGGVLAPQIVQALRLY